ncbi:MAG: hypothetical protein A3C13_03030 [Candidatus Lloydbacteria bacterium RIFCSPHIGHO2_02_FULL_50_11]|nr:MAG: hypothetical protein A3C13_03030 [Candidatus Lloydbacteria bacterium RIFCSPHIGHO2_02_FULL_50_11]
MKVLYRSVLKPVLFRLTTPDTAHDIFVAVGEFAGKYAILRALVSFFYEYKGKNISKVVDGITYRTPILLSAGFDSNGRLTRILRSMSFGGEEIGSTTAKLCEGNPLPRMTRLVRNKSIVVYKGLRNDGVDALIRRLKQTPRIPEYVIGVSIARTNSKEVNKTIEAGIADYVETFKKLNEANIGDYYTINISCPNSFGGETFIDPTLFPRLMAELSKVKCTKPLYIKMPINIPWNDFKQLLETADTYGVQGVIIGNLNKNYKDLDHPEDAPAQFRGGLSGKPCFTLSNELIKKTRAKYGKRLTIIGVGGILTPEDALEKFKAGADLIQMISGMIFGDPGMMKAICERYAEWKSHAVSQ